MTTKQKKNKIKDEIERFIFKWHEFPFDYWWRKRYNVPFGSRTHREMNFIDMYIEYQEELLLRGSSCEDDSDVNDVKLSKQQIDEDYENLDLSNFDK